MRKIIVKERTSELAEFDPRFVQKIARDMAHQAAKIRRGEKVMIHYDPAGRQLAIEIAKLCLKKGCRVWYKVRDTDMDASLLLGLAQKDIARYSEFEAHEIFGCDAYFASLPLHIARQSGEGGLPSRQMPGYPGLGWTW